MKLQKLKCLCIARYLSKITIIFKNDDFIYSKRMELYTFTDFVANFGGILGLFLGVSILSLVEIIYFVIFRKPKVSEVETG